jgi:hypothetical protein
MKSVFKKQYKNPRLAHRLDSDFPDVLPETSTYYFIGIDYLMDRSPFYSRLCKLDKDTPITNAILYNNIGKQKNFI